MTVIIVVLLLICAFISPFTFAQLCPQVNHTICNVDMIDHRCVCAMSLINKEPAPEMSCNRLIKIEDDRINAASITFNIDDTAAHHNTFPEHRFRNAIASSLRINEDQIVMLRQKCNADNDQLIVQFVIRKADQADSVTMPYDPQTALMAPSSIVTRLKALGHLSQLADLDVAKIEDVDQLIPIESIGNNHILSLMALVSGLAIFLTCTLAVVVALRQNRYRNLEAAAAGDP